MLARISMHFQRPFWGVNDCYIKKNLKEKLQDWRTWKMEAVEMILVTCLFVFRWLLVAILKSENDFVQRCSERQSGLNLPEVHFNLHEIKYLCYAPVETNLKVSWGSFQAVFYSTFIGITEYSSIFTEVPLERQ